MSWRPLSIRDDPAKWGDYDALHEGIPEWLWEPVKRWLTNTYLNKTKAGEFFIDVLALRLRKSWTHDTFDRVLGEIVVDDELALDVIDGLLYMLPYLGPAQQLSPDAIKLGVILHEGASVWTVGDNGDEHFELQRRVDATTHAVADAVMSGEGRAAEHLRIAWSKTYGRHPDPDRSYDAAVKGVEVAARPIVTPNDTTATLGKMRSAIGDKPSKWTTPLDTGADVGAVLGMMSALWEGHYRHGDETKPISHSQQDAEVAVHLAVTLVHLFASGAISRTE